MKLIFKILSKVSAAAFNQTNSEVSAEEEAAAKAAVAEEVMLVRIDHKVYTNYPRSGNKINKSLCSFSGGRGGNGSRENGYGGWSYVNLSPDSGIKAVLDKNSQWHGGYYHPDQG